MNIVERAFRGLDDWQQRHRVPAFVIAVVKKFGDDQGGNLVALLTYFAFLATFPLLLALTAILGLVLRGHPHLQEQVSNSALSEFPIIGPQLHSQVGLSSLHNGGFGLVIGIVGSILGGRGLANAVQNTLNTVWNVPLVHRPGFPWNWLRTLSLLGLLGLGVVLTAAATAVSGGAARLVGLHGTEAGIISLIVSAILDIGLFFAAYRIATAKSVRSRDLLLGAIISGVAWQILLSFAGIVINHYLRHAQAVAGLFGIVLGLIAWFGLQATVMVYAIEIDVVRTRRLWPRGLTQPPLTRADRQFLTAATDASVRRPEQHITTTFSEEASRDPRNEPPETTGPPSNHHVGTDDDKDGQDEHSGPDKQNRPDEQGETDEQGGPHEQDERPDDPGR